MLGLLAKRSKFLLAPAQRAFAAPISDECRAHLDKLGITNKNIVFNPSAPELYEYALHPETAEEVNPLIYPSSITSTGALSVASGARTGRSPNDKRIVLDDTTKDTIWWGKVNIPMPPEGFSKNRKRAVDFFNTKKKLYVIDGYGGWDEKNRVKCRVIATRPYHALFMKVMMIRDETDALVKNFTAGGPDFTIMNAGEFVADTTTESVTNPTSVAVNFTDKQLVILGT